MRDIDFIPLSVTEAMSRGRPCVISRVGDMAVWIRDSENGYLANEVSINGIDEVLERAWKDREHWETLGKNAQSTFLQKYPRPFEPFYENLFAAHLLP